jgi:hypothetical protein
MTYSLHFSLKGVSRGTSHYRGTREDAIVAARAGLESHGADTARVLDETGHLIADVQHSV